VIRRLTAAALVVLVQLGVTTAPLVHVHVGEEASHHAAEAAHAHLGGAVGGAGNARLDHPDGGLAIAPQMFVAVAVDPFDAPALTAPAFTLLVPPEAAAGRTPHVTHGHDPPSHRLLPSRAPPAFLS
jgi:hypothetical protein